MLLEEDLSYRIRGCVYEVFKNLGAGYLEKVYEKALSIELQMQGLHVKTQVPYSVQYKGRVVGNYYADFLVQDSIILELKAQDKISNGWESQLINYLKISNNRIGLLVNFSMPKATIKRVVL